MLEYINREHYDDANSLAFGQSYSYGRCLLGQKACQSASWAVRCIAGPSMHRRRAIASLNLGAEFVVVKQISATTSSRSRCRCRRSSRALLAAKPWKRSQLELKPARGKSKLPAKFPSTVLVEDSRKLSSSSCQALAPERDRAQLGLVGSACLCLQKSLV